MHDFDAMRKANESFISTVDSWPAYLAWLQTCACQWCGAKYVDRPRDANGKCTDAWFTETDCGCRSRLADR